MASKTQGLHTHRLKDNPKEAQFSLAWRKYNNQYENAVAYLLNGSNLTPCARDQIVAATVIQWLGSPVGQNFLSNLGYTQVKDPHSLKKRSSPKRLCEACVDMLVPGALFPIAADGNIDHAYVQACDDCRLFDSDEDAAVAVAAHLEKESALTTGDQRPFILGISFSRAQALTRSKKRG